MSKNRKKSKIIKEIIKEDENYEVESIVQHKLQRNGVYRYKVKWRGYGSDYDTWEPESCFNEPDEMLMSYKRKHGLPIKETKRKRKAEDTAAISKKKKMSETKSDKTDQQPKRRTRMGKKRRAEN